MDYIHCVCEGVVDQLISRWLDKSNSKVEEISKELTSVTITCEITRSPRSLADVKDWKGNSTLLLRVILSFFVINYIHFVWEGYAYK